MKNVFLLLFCYFTLTSCKTKKNASSDSPIETTSIDTREGIKDTRAFFKTIHKKNRFKRLKIKNKIKIKTDAFIPRINGTLYIENNKKIWINLSALSFNIGRGLAEKKEFKGYLKQPEKIAIEGNYESLKQILGLDFLNYESLQNLLLGRTFIPVNDVNYILTQNMQGYTLTSMIPIDLNEVNGEKFHVTLAYSKAYELQHVQIVNTSKTELVEIHYANRILLNKLNLPQNVKIIIKGSKNTEILIENTKFEDSVMKTPFRIPKNYKKVPLHD